MSPARLFAVAWCLTAAGVHAHPLHLTTVTVYLDETATRVTAVAHMAHLTGPPPRDNIRARLRIRLDGTPFRPSDIFTSVNETGETVTWQAREARAAAAVEMDAPLFPDSPGDSTVVLVYRNGQLVDRTVLTPESPHAILAESAFAFSRRFIGMGIHHILSGLDHVLFVLALVMVRGTFPGLLAVITAFTIAHSITLNLTALEVGSLPSRLVEPLIALSIVAVGAENLASKTLNLERRIWVAFGFGFFHGFGFAGALVETGLPRDSIAWALGAFNVGVEIGQASIVLLTIPLLRALHQRSSVVTMAVTRCASIAISAAGLVWFFERLRA